MGTTSIQARTPGGDLGQKERARGFQLFVVWWMEFLCAKSGPGSFFRRRQLNFLFLLNAVQTIYYSQRARIAGEAKVLIGFFV